MLDHEALKENILRRVWRVYYLRKVLNPVALKAYALTLFTMGAASLVSVPNIVANLAGLSGFSDAAAFLYGAIANTEFAVQALAVGIAATALFLVRDLAERALPLHARA